MMKLKMLKSKKVIIVAVSMITVFIALGILIYFNSVNKKVEISAQPADKKIEETNDEYIDISQLEELEESQENLIDENTQNQEKDDNTTKEKQKQVANTNKNTAPYYIKVNYGAQVVTIYKKDENGDYTVPTKAMVCSTGVATPKSGVYSIPARWRWLGLQGGVCGQYCTQIKGNILFHSVPYLRRGELDSLEYWEYDKLGTYASAGCIRLTVKDAKWIYDNCAKGTKVEFYSSADPGPLGKPSAKKISSYPDYLRNWDPTDPDSNNPWKNYKEGNNSTTANSNTNTQDNKNNTTNTNTQTNTQDNKNNTTNTNTQTNTQDNKNNTANTDTQTNTQDNKNNTANTDTQTNTQDNKNNTANTDTQTNMQDNKNNATNTNTQTNTQDNKNNTTNTNTQSSIEAKVNKI